jgi:hypothetical protein
MNLISNKKRKKNLIFLICLLVILFVFGSYKLHLKLKLDKKIKLYGENLVLIFNNNLTKQTGKKLKNYFDKQPGIFYYSFKSHQKKANCSFNFNKISKDEIIQDLTDIGFKIIMDNNKKGKLKVINCKLSS